MKERAVYKKILYFSIILAFFGAALFVVLTGDTYSREETKTRDGKPEDRLIIAHADIFGRLERPGVLFDHGLHVEASEKESCDTCHPRNDDGNLIFAFPFRLMDRNREHVMDGFHKKCIGCHNRMTEAKKKAGPVRCGECHAEEKHPLRTVYPRVDFDFTTHEKHVRSLQKRCILCHHSYNEELVYEEGTEQSCYYCHDAQEQRGPSLAEETKLTLAKGLSIRNVSHARCVNCHLDRVKEGAKAGPVACAQCHTGRYRTIEELSKVSRPDRDQPETHLIHSENGRMKGVHFDHAFHEKNTPHCRCCHHDTLRACRECHGPKGNAKGAWISAAHAYHDIFSGYSCAGCHNARKADTQCAGCHHHLTGLDMQKKGQQREYCGVCHSGKREVPVQTGMRALSELTPEKVPEKVTVNVLEKEYEPAVFPHLRIIRKLAAISNESKMASYFHQDVRTLCRGCHHRSDAGAEAARNKPPYCRNCHSVTFDPKDVNRPRLLAVYHRQCMACHEKMKIRAVGCEDCHKAKKKGPDDIL